MKAGILEEMVEDTMEGLEGEEEEDAAQEPFSLQWFTLKSMAGVGHWLILFLFGSIDYEYQYLISKNVVKKLCRYYQ